MTSEDLVHMALALPGTEENAHFGKRDFRVAGRIFLTLPEAGRAVCKLTRGQQAMLVATQPGLCAAVPGGWGHKGWTSLYFDSAELDTVHHIVETAWRNVAPTGVVDENGGPVKHLDAPAGKHFPDSGQYGRNL